MYVANPIDPSFPTIRYLSELGPASGYPLGTGHPAHGARRRRGQRGQLSAVAGVVLAVAAFGAGFIGGFTAAAPMPQVARPVQGPMPGEFRLGPGNLTPPGIVVPLS
jgi:hypothetical protein